MVVVVAAAAAALAVVVPVEGRVLDCTVLSAMLSEPDVH